MLKIPDILLMLWTIVVSILQDQVHLSKRTQVTTVARAYAWPLLTVHTGCGSRAIHAAAFQIFPIFVSPGLEASTHQRKRRRIQCVEPFDQAVYLARLPCGPPVSARKLLPAGILELSIDGRRFALEVQIPLARGRAQSS